jgi:putative ABC transport system permease protein
MGLIGLVPGALGGLGLAFLINLVALPSMGHPIVFSVKPMLLVGSLLGGYAIVILAAWIPAERAARLKLTEALHYE